MKKLSLAARLSSSKKLTAAAAAPAATSASVDLPATSVDTASSIGDVAPSAPPPAAAAAADSGGGDLAAARAEAAAAKAEAENLRTQVTQLTADKEALKGHIHLLMFKVDLLTDMVTLANLDCDKLEDELEVAANGDGKPRASRGDDDANGDDDIQSLATAE